MSDDLVERVAHELTGYIGSTCCHKTGGRSADPRCECRLLARAAIAVVLEEAAKVAEECAPVSQDTWSMELAERCDMVAAAIRAMAKEDSDE